MSSRRYLHHLWNVRDSRVRVSDTVAYARCLWIASTSWRCRVHRTDGSSSVVLPEMGLPQVAALLVVIGLALVLSAMSWRFWAAAGTADHRDLGAVSVFRIMLGVAGGIVLAVVLLTLLAAALAQ